MKYYIIGFVLLAFVSCEEPIDLHLESMNEQLLFVEGSITTDSIHQQVIIKRTKDYVSDNYFEPDATLDVKIIELKNEMVQRVLSLQYSVSKGLYETDSMVKGIPGMTYRLQIRKPGIEITAQEFLKPIVRFDTAGFIRMRNPETGDTLFALAFSFMEPDSTIDDAYMREVFYNDSSLTDTLRQKSFTNDDFSNGELIKGMVSPSVFRKKRGEPQFLRNGDIVTIKVSVLNEKYYQFIGQTFQLLYSGNIPFAGPAANPKGNLYLNGKNGGVYGYFSAKAISRIYVMFDSLNIPPLMPSKN